MFRDVVFGGEMFFFFFDFNGYSKKINLSNFSWGRFWFRGCFILIRF